MALTPDDLQQIKGVVNEVVHEVVHDVVRDEVKGLATKADLDRMEGRLTMSMSLLERDTFTRLDQHEARISRLEAAQH